MKGTLKIEIILLAVLIVILGDACNSNNTSNQKSAGLANSTDTAIISFREYEHDFGKITEGEEVAYIFTFENKGKGPLVISSVTTSCGCTVPKYDTKPIESGGTGTVEVAFNSSGRNGMQNKTITVKSNASKPVVLLKISGEVITSKNN